MTESLEYIPTEELTEELHKRFKKLVVIHENIKAPENYDIFASLPPHNGEFNLTGAVGMLHTVECFLIENHGC